MLRVVLDQTDNRILECALEAVADVLVTGNLKHIRPLAFFEGIDILTPVVASFENRVAAELLRGGTPEA